MAIKGLNIDRNLNVSPSVQIERFLRTAIQQKKYAPGDRLPTTSQIMAAAGVGPQTVRHAIGVLEKDGLVQSVPGRGTFVIEKTLRRDATGSADQSPQKLRTVAIAGAFTIKSEGGWYKRLTITGIARQCEVLGVNFTILVDSLAHSSAVKIKNYLDEIGSDGLVWLYPEPEIWHIIDELEKLNVQMVVLRRSHGTDNICSVETDFEIVGFDAARYFIENNCQKILFVSYLRSQVEAIEQMRHGSWPCNVTNGFDRALKTFVGKSDGLVEELALDGYEASSEKLHRMIRQHGPEFGLFFIDAMQLLKYILDFGDQAMDALSDRKIVVITNRDNYSLFLPYAKDLNIMTFMELPEQVGALAIHRLSSLLMDPIDKTCTLLKPEVTLEEFSATKLIKEAVSGMDLHKSF